jgi:Dna[CI] antecedent, DciA
MQPIVRAVPGALAALLRPMPLSPGKVEFAWSAAVGAAVQRVTTARLEGTVLLVDAASPHWARAVSQSSRIIRSRLDALLGEGVVTEVLVRSVEPRRSGGS